MKKLTLICFLIICAAAVTVSASEKGSQTSDSTVLIPEPLVDYYINGQAPEKLSYCIDLWYDAALKGDTKKVGHFEKCILEILRTDLDSSNLILSLYSKQLDEFQKAVLFPDSSDRTDSVIFQELLASQALLDQERNTCIKKEKLFQEFSLSPTISNKYRLVSDYIDVLRKQLGMPKLKFAVHTNKSSVPSEGKAKAKN
jgi:hypothetical protein